MSCPSFVLCRLASQSLSDSVAMKICSMELYQVNLDCPSYPVPAADSIETYCLIMQGLSRAFLGMECKKGEEGWKSWGALSHSWTSRLGPQAMVIPEEGLGFPVR